MALSLLVPISWKRLCVIKLNWLRQKQIVRSCGTKLQRDAENNAPVDTGTLKRSITIEIEDDGLTAVIAPHTEYAAYVEYGTRYMTAQPYMRPAYEEVKAEF